MHRLLRRQERAEAVVDQDAPRKPTIGARQMPRRPLSSPRVLDNQRTMSFSWKQSAIAPRLVGAWGTANSRSLKRPRISGDEHRKRDGRDAEHVLRRQPGVDVVTDRGVRVPGPLQRCVPVIVNRNVDHDVPTSGLASRWPLERSGLGPTRSAPTGPHVDGQRAAAVAGKRAKMTSPITGPWTLPESRLVPAYCSALYIRQYSRFDLIAASFSRRASSPRVLRDVCLDTSLVRAIYMCDTCLITFRRRSVRGESS